GAGIQTGSYSLTLTGTSGSLSETQTLSLTVTKLVGVENIISLDDFSISDSGGPGILGEASLWLSAVVSNCFSIQQNFYVNVPGKAFPTYWVQNVLLIGTAPLGIVLWSGYMIFDASNLYGGPIARNSIPGHVTISLPATLTLTSVISGDQLTLTSDYNSFTFSLGGTGAYVSRLNEP